MHSVLENSLNKKAPTISTTSSQSAKKRVTVINQTLLLIYVRKKSGEK